MSKIRWCFFLFIFFFLGKSSATHIVGGEMNYRYLGNNDYEVSLTVYRDCFNGLAPFDNPASIGIFDVNGNLVDAISCFISVQQSVPNVVNSPCLVPPTNVCYEVANYTFITNLPPIPGGYTLAYQRCCRNNSIVNLANVQGTGATYFATIPDQSIAAVNSNPKFINWPPTFICMGAPFTFNHSAIDYEGDSLVYSVYLPYEGADQFDPMPVPPASPPYSHVQYQNPYSLNNVFGGTPLEIDPVTGILKATPSSLGQFVYGISVKEYRNGVLLSETLRDFQVNVVPCPQITVASIFSPTISCGSLVANFQNTSFNAATYQWNFGDPLSLSDTSSLRDPAYAYTDTGDYLATLIAYSGIDPACNDTARGIVHIYPVFESAFDINNHFCDHKFTFIDRSHGIGGIANFWSWDFGDDSTSSDPSPSHVYSNPGQYSVTLITSSDSSCYDTLSKTIYIQKTPIADFGIQLDTCTYTITAIDSSVNASSYRWDFGDGVLDFIDEPNHQYASSGTFTIEQIIVTDSFCIDTAYLSVTIPKLPVSDFTYSALPCDSTIQFTNSSTDGFTYEWDFGDNTQSTDLDPVHTYELAGTIPVNLTSTSIYGCEQTVEKEINFTSFKEAHFNATQDSCSGLVQFYDVTENAVSYHWEFGDGEFSDVKNPSHTYKGAGDYYPILLVNKESVCLDSTSMKVKSEDLLGELLFVPNSFTPNGDGKNDLFEISAYRPCVIYSIEVFDRWGEMVYQNDDAGNMHWDGTYRGRQIPNDVYVYLLKNDEQVRKGLINLMR
jgi:gliding motility-associated-like protein